MQNNPCLSGSLVGFNPKEHKSGTKPPYLRHLAKYNCPFPLAPGQRQLYILVYVHAHVCGIYIPRICACWEGDVISLLPCETQTELKLSLFQLLESACLCLPMLVLQVSTAMSSFSMAAVDLNSDLQQVLMSSVPASHTPVAAIYKRAQPHRQ